MNARLTSSAAGVSGTSGPNEGDAKPCPNVPAFDAAGAAPRSITFNSKTARNATNPDTTIPAQTYAWPACPTAVDLLLQHDYGQEWPHQHPVQIMLNNDLL